MKLNENVAANRSSASKKLNWKQKVFLGVIGGVVVSFAAVYADEASQDRALTIETVTSADAQPDYANGKGIDFVQRFRLRMNEAILPVEDNGWREILQALGPRALEQKQLANEVPWEEISTNKKSKGWYETYWTPICEKFGLDPKTKPTFWDRLDLVDYLVKYGITGKEVKTDTSSDSCADYWENGERKDGLVGFYAVEECCFRLYGGAWTAEEFPTAARWIEENADLYDVYAQAVRKNNFRMLHLIGDEPFAALEVLLPDVQYAREIARLLVMRANYRIGKGDLDGAAEDYRSILLIGKKLLDANDLVIVEGLVGLADLCCALDVAIDGNRDARPTKETYVRLCEALDDVLASYDSRELTRRVIQGEYDALYLSMLQDFVLQRREKGEVAVLKELDLIFNEQSGEQSKDKSRGSLEKDGGSLRGAFDDVAFMLEAEKYWKERFQTLGLEDADVSANPEKRLDKDSPESKLLDEAASFLVPDDNICYAAFQRVECVIKTQRIVLAMLRYQAEHGTLPPAFTVDAEGKPLHSWRVLILPYLDEEAKALYEKIRLDEPWDSEYNKQFHAVMPQIYRCPSNDRRSTGVTGYSTIIGEGSLFDASGVGKDLNALRSRKDVDVSRQALIVERLDLVVWMRPDAELSAQDCMGSLDEIEKARTSNVQGTAAKGVGSRHINGMNIGCADGSCRFQSLSDPLKPITTGIAEEE